MYRSPPSAAVTRTSPLASFDYQPGRSLSITIPHGTSTITYALEIAYVHREVADRLRNGSKLLLEGRVDSASQGIALDRVMVEGASGGYATLYDTRARAPAGNVRIPAATARRLFKPR